MNSNWHTQAAAAVIAALRSTERGLESAEARRRRIEFGPNKLPEAKPDHPAVIFLRQFESPLIYILLAAGVIVFAMNEVVDGGIILFVLLFNAVVGTIQEGKAQNTLLALKQFVETNATVLRDAKEYIIPDSEVVPGDILMLVEGDKVPADSRIIISHNLKIDEASLTGESVPVHKIAETLAEPDLPTAEQKNMVFKGTHIVAGRGQAVVVATGLRTAVGKIATAIASIDTEIPLKTNIRYLSRLIIITVAGISATLFSLGIILGKSLTEMFTTVVALSVSIIPEGLPIVVTLVLATGVWRMSKRNALVKRLQAVEALGQVRVIAVDKTGTITKNELTIQQVYAGGTFFEVGGIGYEPRGGIRLGGNIIDPLNHAELLFAGKVSALCANAHAAYDPENKTWRVFGDPTEAALTVFAEKVGLHKDALEHESPQTAEIPFDNKTKYHATAHRVDGQALVTVVGAPEVVLRLISSRWGDGADREISKRDKENLESVFLGMSRQGLRVLALAVKERAPHTIGPEDIRDLAFVGFVGMRDALRPEVKAAVRMAIAAGIRVKMITGDHTLTAQSIAKEAGIYREGDEVLTGHDIDAIADDELSQKVDRVSVFARVTPEHKLRIINAYRKRGEIVAMTGDGVNDATSLVAADLGVAMGRIGTEVAKEASDIVLLDDNFGSIVSAVEEGRSIYKTIKKVILYLFSTSVGEVLTIAGALVLGYPLPILAAQIIWLNLVTDGFLDVALAMEPKEEGLLQGDFERPKKYLVDKLMAQRMFLMAMPMMAGTLFLFKDYFAVDMVKAWTVSLTTLAVFQWFNAWNCRHESKSIFQMNPLSNKFLVAATGIIVVLQLFAIYNPVMQKVLRTAPLGLSEWLLIIPVAASIVLVEELRKLLHRRAGRRR